MKIAIDTLGENPLKPSSAINLLIELIKSCKAEKDTKFIIFISSKNKNIFANYKSKNIKFVNCFFSNENIFLRILAQQLLIPLFLLIYKCDAIYCPINSAPLLTFKPVFLKINTLHHIDLPKEFPVGFLRKIYRNIMFGLSAKKAKVIIANTKYLKNRITSHYGFKDEKVKISYEAYSEGFGIYNKEFSRKYILDHYGISYSYIIYPSNLYNYKNHKIALKSYAELMKLYSGDLKIIFLGRDEHNIKSELINLSDKLKITNKVNFIDFVPIEDAIHLINASSIMFYPSRMETFGKPIIEGMISKIPVVGTNIPPIKELSLDSKFLSDVDDYKGIGKKLFLSLEADQNYLNDCFNKAKTFTYKNHNKKIFEIINLYLN